MSQHGYLDIPHAQLERYRVDAAKKVGTCRVIPRARFAITSQGPVYDGLVCSPYDMGGEATGVGASGCTNCVRGADNGNG